MQRIRVLDTQKFGIWTGYHYPDMRINWILTWMINCYKLFTWKNGHNLSNRIMLIGIPSLIFGPSFPFSFGESDVCSKPHVIGVSLRIVAKMSLGIQWCLVSWSKWYQMTGQEPLVQTKLTHVGSTTRLVFVWHFWLPLTSCYLMMYCSIDQRCGSAVKNQHYIPAVYPPFTRIKGLLDGCTPFTYVVLPWYLLCSTLGFLGDYI